MHGRKGSTRRQWETIRGVQWGQYNKVLAFYKHRHERLQLLPRFWRSIVGYAKEVTKVKMKMESLTTRSSQQNS
jgi:hypothetical protein